jgi:hypothetical protein
MAINLDQYTNTLSVTDTATNADLNVTTKGTGVVNLNTGNGVVFKVTDSGATSVDFIQAASTSFSRPSLVARPVSGSGTINFALSSFGVGSIQFNTNNLSQEQLRVSHTASAVNYVQATGAATGNAPYFSSQGSDTNINFAYTAKGTGNHDFYTSGTSFTQQFRISHTASAVNYVQVTGAATGNSPAISAQGSDANIQIQLQAKGTGIVRFATGGGLQAYVSDTASAVNYLQVTGAATGASPVLLAQGSDTNIDIIFTPKGTTGNVRFGTYTGTILTPTGYVEIKDSGGTVRRLLVG